MEELSKIIKSYREKSNISLDDISEKTKIRKFVLLAIEEGDFSKLPPIYGKSFVKEYIEFLEIPEEEYIVHYTTLLEELNIQKTDYNPIKSSDYGKLVSSPKLFGLEFTPGIINISFYISLAILVIVIIYLGVFYDGDNSDDSINTSTPVDSIEIDQIERPVQTLVRDSIMLEAFAIDSCWIEVKIDGEVKQQALMAPNTRKNGRQKNSFL